MGVGYALAYYVDISFYPHISPPLTNTCTTKGVAVQSTDEIVHGVLLGVIDNIDSRFPF